MTIVNTIRKMLYALAKNNCFAERVLIVLRWQNNKRFRRMSDVEYTKMLWKREGRTIHLDAPKTYDEKMWFLKLSNRDPLLTLCSDKHLVRKYIEECGLGHLLKQEYATFQNAREINFEELPSPCYIKCNNASGENWIFDQHKAFNRRHVIWKFNYYLKNNPYWLSREWNYKNIKPLIVCEEVLAMPDGGDIPEIQFFCFSGEPKFIMYNMGLADKQGNHKKAIRWVFDMNYDLIHVKTSMETNDTPPKKPKNFEKMIQYARILAKPFPHVRVDLFDIEGRIVFNELTFYSGGGFVKLDPESWQDTIGNWLDISGYTIAKDALQKPSRC